MKYFINFKQKEKADDDIFYFDEANKLMKGN